LHTLSAVQRFTDDAGERARAGAEQVSPLVAQAEMLASYLSPAQLKQETGGNARPPLINQPPQSELVPPVRPAVASVNFKLHGTSCCPNQPGRSMALISELGSLEGSERWVKEGAQVGHFVIHEIRQNGIVYRDGDQLREMAVESFVGPTSIVQDVRPGSRRVSAVIQEVGASVPSPIEPNGAAVSGK